MGSNLRKGLFLVTITGAVAAFPYTVQASDAAGQEHVLPQAGIGEVLSDCYLSDKEIQVEDYLVPEEKGEYLDMAFADVQTFLYIRSEPTTESEWLGKLYPGNAARILGPVGEWTKIQSGQVTGYVYSDYIIIGKNAEEKAREVGEEAFKLGNIWEGVTNREAQQQFADCNVYAHPECRDCWARLYCAGGCAANAYHATGSIRGVYEMGCELFRKRMECAIMVEASRLTEE